jgi:hypothetical protein
MDSIFPNSGIENKKKTNALACSGLLSPHWLLLKKIGARELSIIL